MLRRVLGHSRGIHCVQCGPRWCVSASYSTVFVWDILTENEAETITGFNCRCRLVSKGNVTALQYGELEVITGDSLGAISVWWIESGELLKSFDAHNSPVASLQVDSTKAISCGLDMIVVVSDIMRGEVLHSLRGHKAPVLDVAFDRKQIISLSSDGELRYWSWESPSNHFRSDIKAETITYENEPNLCGDFGSKKENLNIEKDGREVSDSRSNENKGTLMNRLVRFPFRRSA